jgi:hypothetical protein
VDSLVRQYVLIEDEAALLNFDLAELVMEDPGTTAMVVEGRLPNCDLCDQARRKPTPARYDSGSSPKGRGPWAFMCPDCFALNSSLTLGMGMAQYLFTRHELTDEVRDAFYRAREFWIGQGADPSPYDPFETD